ncbi:MAG: hypothetical protein JKY65_12100 [Planctomycetes bacterium]|nr:hypothetical protein [Planctomycetota bacterium]
MLVEAMRTMMLVQAFILLAICLVCWSMPEAFPGPVFPACAIALGVTVVLGLIYARKHSRTPDGIWDFWGVVSMDRSEDRVA